MEGKHHNVAVGAVARKLCYTIYTVLKNNVVYEVQVPSALCRIRHSAEDSQILWWLMSEHCSTLNKSVRSLDKAVGCLLLGKEAANFINNFPGPTAIQAVLNKMIGNCKGKSEQLTIAQAISHLSEDVKEQLTLTPKGFPAIELLPLISAISRSKNTINPDEWYPKYKREILFTNDDCKLTPQEFAWQMYIECLALKCYSQCK